MNVMPWCVTFFDRMSWFRSIVDSDKLHVQGTNDMSAILSGGAGSRTKGIVVKVRMAQLGLY
jgi:hypothetical protein